MKKSILDLKKYKFKNLNVIVGGVDNNDGGTKGKATKPPTNGNNGSGSQGGN